MKLETFFEKFDQFADAPDAVAKMRKLILQLAVQGRLKSQDNESGFPQVRLDSLGSWAQGCGFPVTEQGHADRPILFSKVSDMNLPGNEREILKTNHTIDEATAKRLRIKVHPPGTVIFPKIGGAIATNKRRVLVRPTAIDNNCSGIIPNKSCSTHWLFLVLSAIDFAEYQSGTSVPAVNQGALGEIEVSLPPLAEQKRIVAKVDELMALCDRLEAQQQERETRHAALARASLARFADAPTPANLSYLFHSSFIIHPSDLRRSILTLAVQGKLVPQDPNDEPADELLERIQAERAEQEAKGAYKSSRPLEPIEETEEPFKLPVEWKWARLRSLVFTLGDGLHGTPEYSDGTDCYFINGNNLVDGRIVIKPHTKTVSLDEAKKHRKPMTLSTVLVSINGTLGSVAFYNNENVILGKSACYFNLASLVNKHFARRVIESPYFVNYASENATGTTIRNLGLKAMNYFPFPLPPLAEQRRIVAKVEQLMALVDALETQLAASRATAANLLSALVAELTDA